MCTSFAGDLANAVRKNSDIHFGIYHSLFEWFNPLYMDDAKNNYTTQRFVAVSNKSSEMFDPATQCRSVWKMNVVSE
jgi:hypothetical protein